MVEDKNMTFYNTIQTSSETPKKLTSIVIQSKKHPFLSDMSQQMKKFNEK